MMTKKQSIKLLAFLLILTSCQIIRSKEPAFSFVPVFDSYGIDKKSVDHLSREVFFDDVTFFGQVRFGNSRVFKHSLNKPVKCRKGTIVELGSCCESLNCKTHLWVFEITNEEHWGLFRDSTQYDYSKYKLTTGIRTIKFDQSEQLLLVKEYDSTNKKLTNILITGYHCFITETLIIGKYKEKNYTANYSADVSTSDLREFSSPLEYIWERTGNFRKLRYLK